MTDKQTSRRHDLDWVRVLVFALLIFYHVGMYFVPWNWHINNDRPIDWLRWPMVFLNQWRLPILFVISGMGTYYAFGKRSTGGFIKERILRLFIPLLFGILIIVPPQVYWERLHQGVFSGSFLDFWPSQIFNGIYPEGNFSWHHLWFLPYLLVFSLLFASFFSFLRNRAQFPEQWGQKLSEHPERLFYFILPLYLFEALLEPFFPVTHALVGDWFALATFGWLFFSGFLLVSMGEGFWTALARLKTINLCLGMCSFALLVLRWNFIEDSTLVHFTEALVKVVNFWAWILFILAIAAKYLNRPSKTLVYANRAVYPFYILHQTITLGIGYYLLEYSWSWEVKAFIMTCGTFLLAWSIYAFIVLPVPLLHPLFGLKKIPPKKT